MPVSNYVYLLNDKGPHTAVVSLLNNVDKDYQLLEDVSRIADFPADAHFDMLPDYGLQLPDFLANVNGLLVVSEEAKAFMEAQEEIDAVEMLPVTIVDHKGHPVETPYYIMHLLGFQDAIDKAKSEGRMWSSNPDDYRRIFTLVLDESRINEGKAIFRLKHYPYPVIVRRDLAERIAAAGLTGILFDEIEDFDPFAIL